MEGRACSRAQPVPGLGGWWGGCSVVRVLLSDGASHRSFTVLWRKTMQSYNRPRKLQSKGYKS